MSTPTVNPAVAAASPAAQSFLGEILTLFAHLPFDLAQEVNFEQLVGTVETAIEQHADVLQAVIGAASLIIPGSLPLQLALRILGVVLALRGHGSAA